MRGLAMDTAQRCRSGRETLVADRPATVGADAVGPGPVPLECGVQLGQGSNRLIEQRLGLGPLEADRGAFGVVLVIAGRGRGRGDDVGELSLQPGHPSGRRHAGLLEGRQESSPRSRRSLATCPVALTLYCAISPRPDSSTTKVDR